MPQRKVVVTAKQESSRLPVWANEYVVMMQWLQVHGFWAAVEHQIPILRQRGYLWPDILAFLLAYFCWRQCRLEGGLARFWEESRPYGKRLAAMAERRNWPSNSAVSRYLAAVRQEHVEPLSKFWLCDVLSIHPLFQEPSLRCFDTQGEEWDFFDFDPTVTTLRHRALPQGQDLPPPVRRSQQIARPGYPGRKRGDVQLERTSLQHAGNGLWLGIWMAQGNGQSRPHQRKALSTIVHWAEEAQRPLERMVMRSDGGANGGVPGLWDYRHSQVHYLTRSSRYELLQWPQVRARLSEARWEEVSDSGSGPKRWATEVGQVRLSSSCKDAQGRKYEPFETRMVVSRFEAPEKKRGVGKLLDGQVYELFPTSLPVSHFGPSEVVESYYGRCGQENRFSQEDRHLGLDRILSYHLPGQCLANTIGLFLWNWRTCLGAEVLGALDCQLPHQELRSVAVLEPLADKSALRALEPSSQEHNPRCPVPVSDSQGLDHSSQEALEPSAELPDKAAHRAPSERRSSAPLPGACPLPASAVSQPGTLKDAAHQAVLPAPKAPAWRELAKDAPLMSGWNWALPDGLNCPQGTLLRFHSQRTRPNGALYVRFRASTSDCRPCPLRSVCSNSVNPNFKKEFGLTLHPPSCGDLGPPSSAEACGALATSSISTGNAYSPKPKWKPPEQHEAGQWQLRWPSLVPTVLRQGWLSVCLALEVLIELFLPPEAVASPPFLATTSAQRQRRRKTFSERLSCNQLPLQAKLRVKLHGAERLKVVLKIPDDADAEDDAA